MGFIGGYWLEPAGGEGFGFVLFDTEEQDVDPLRRCSAGQHHV
jgi:hypothetical protein